MSGIATLGPYGTYVAVSSVSALAIGSNSNRNGIIFFNSSSTVTIYLAPGNLTAVVNQGIVLLPQMEYKLLPTGSDRLGYGAAWNAICSSAASMLVMEFMGA